MKPLEKTQLVVNPSIGTTIPNRSIAIFDTTVEGWEGLAAGVIPGTEVVVLHPQQDGVAQIGNFLTNCSNIAALHIVSHGRSGGLYLGSVLLNADNLDSYSQTLGQWRNALSGKAEILLYGCEVAAGEIGERFVQCLSEITGADIAASQNKTGSAAQGGDWLLESATGDIEAGLAFSPEAIAAYQNVLAPTETGIQLNGSSSVSIANSADFNLPTALTVESWFKADGFTNNWETIISKGDSSWRLARGGGPSGTGDTIEFTLGSVSTTLQYITGTTNVNDGQWHHVAGVYDGSTMSLYIDGVLQGTATYTGPLADNAFDVLIGENAESTGRYFNGQIDEVRIWNTARTQAEIQADMNQDIDPTTTGLLGYWKFNEGTGTTATDSSGGDNAGTLQGGATWFDVTPPTVSLTSAAATTVNAPFSVTATFSENTTNFIASDISVTNGTVSGFSGSGKTYTFTVNPTTQGTVTVDVLAGVATDAAGNNNTAATALTRTFDSAAPTVSSFTPTDNGLSVAVASDLVLQFNENVQTGTGNIVIKKVSDNSVVETIAVTSGNVTVSGSTVTINPTLDLDEATDYYVEIAAGAIQDLAGNNFAGITGATAWNFTTEDTTPPNPPTIANISSDSGIANDGITNDATLIFAGTAEANSTVTLFKDGTSIGTAPADASGNWTFDYTGTTLADGNYNFTATATDAASNTSSPSTAFAVTVDTTAPIVTINQDPGQPDPTAGTTINFEVVFSEPVTGFNDTDITIGGTAGATTANVTGSGSTYNVAVTGMTGPGTITASVNAGAVTDVAGNTSTASTSSDNEVTYDNSIPTVTSIARADADPSNAGIVNYTVTFSEDVTGVNATDFSLAPGSIADAAITSVTGSGDTYTITVNTGTGDGTVQLNLTDDDTIINSLSVPLGGVGTGNGDSTGQIYTVDKTEATVTTITSTLANGSYPVGQVIPISVTFDEVVTVTGTPELTLNSGGSATYNSGNGTNTLTFNYTVATGESTTDLEATALTLAGGTITDAAGNDATLTVPTAGSASSLGGAKNFVIDTTVPTVTLASTAASIVNEPFEVSATFSETVTGFAATDISVTNGTVSNLTGSGTSYSFMVTPTGDGTVTVNVPASGATDAAGNPNTAATALTRTADATVPTVTLTSTAASTVNAPFTVSATFSETVTGFAANDVSVTNGTASNLTGSGSNYSFTVTPTGSGTVTVNVPTGGATDAVGNPNTAATALTRTADLAAPTVTLASTAASTVNAPFSVTATFSETVTGFAANDVTVTNGTVSNLTGSGSNYNFTVTPTGEGTVTVNVPAGGATDASGNTNTAAAPLTRTTDSTAPTVTLASTAAETLNAPFEVSATFSETVTGFAASDVSVTNGTVSNLTGSGSSYNFTVTPTGSGTVTVNLPAGAVTDASGNSNTAAAPLTRSFSTTFSVWSALDAYLQNQGINVSASVEQVLQKALNTIAPLTVEIQDSQLTATYNNTGSLNDVLKALGVPVANGSSIFSASIANPSLTLDTSESSPAYNLSGTINGVPVNFGYQSGQSVTASYEGDVSLSDLLSSMGVSGTQGRSILTGAIGNPSLTIDTSESPAAYALSGSINGQTVSFGYQSGQGVTVSYEGDVSLSDLLNQVGFDSGGIGGEILNTPVKNPSLTIDTSKPTTVYTFSGEISGQNVSFSVDKTSIKFAYPNNASLRDLVDKIPVDAIKEIAQEVTPDLTSPYFTIDKSSGTPKYIASGKLDFATDDGQDNFFDFIKQLGINNVTLNAEVSPPNASISANLGTDITLFKKDSFSAILKGLNLKGGLIKGEPTFGIDGSLILKGYDPFQLYEPDLTLFGSLNLEPESLTGSFALKAGASGWVNPFGIPDTKINNLGFQVGGTYLFPYIDNIGFVGDFEFGKLALKSAFLVDTNDPDNFAVELTATKPVGFLDVLAGPIFSYGLNQAAGQSSVIKQAADLFNVINDQITVVSIDSPNDDDTELDPLIKFVPVETTIGNTTLSQGVGINGRLKIGNVFADLNLDANPFSSNPTLNASLTIPDLNLLNGLIKIKGKGTSPKDLTLDIKVDSDEQYIQGNGSLEIFGLKAEADFKITPTSVDINKSFLDLKIAKLAVDYLSVSLTDQTAKGKGELTLFGQSIAGVEFEANSDGLEVKNLNLGWGSVLSLNLDYLNVNSNGTGSAKGKVKLFGEEIFTGDITLTQNSLTVNANLGYNILGEEVGVGVGITLGNDSKITLTANIPLLDNPPPWTIPLNTLSTKFSSITDWLEDLVMGEIGRLADLAIESIEKAFDEVSKAATQAWNSLESFFNDLSTSIANGWNDAQNAWKKLVGGDLSGNDNNNEINGTGHRDHIFGHGGNDKLLGHGGEDYIYGGWGDDRLYGGWGDDRLYGEDGNDFLAGEGNNDYIYGGSGNDLLDGGDGNDVLSGQDHNDRLSGGFGHDHLYGGWGADILYGDGGHDNLFGEQSNDVLHGGTGNDTLWGGSADYWTKNIVHRVLDPSNDSLYGNEGNDYLYGEGSEDFLDGGSGDDFLYGGGENDRLLGQAGNDVLAGDGGNDELHGSHGEDSLYGGSGNDVLYGQQGHDLLRGEDGNDTLYGDDDGQQGQTYNGSWDNDTLYGDGGSDYLFGGTGQDYLYGGWDDDFLDGGSGNDFLSGESGNDTVRGDDGNDTLIGGNGNNVLSGGNDNDRLISLLNSKDTISGGAGDDTLVLVGKETDYTFTKTNTGWEITNKSDPNIVKIVTEVEHFEYNQTLSINDVVKQLSNNDFVKQASNVVVDVVKQVSNVVGQFSGLFHRGRVIDGYIADGQIFFDANLNGVLDENEPFATTNADGTFDLAIDIEQFDTNQDTELDHTEGQLVLMGGVDIATGLPLVTPLTSTLRSTVVTPLTTIIANLVQQGTDPAAAETQVKSALGLSAEVELGSYDPLEAITNGETEGASVFGSMIQVQNTIVQMAKFMEGVAETPLTQLAYSGIGAIANQFKGGTSVDLGNLQTVQSILQDAMTQAAKSDPNINPTQLAATAAAAAQIIALGNQMIAELISSGASPTDIVTDITKLQAVSVGEIAVGLPELAAGKVSIEEFLAKNTKEAILARMEAVKVNDPTSRTLEENNPLDNEDTPDSSQPQPFPQGLPSNGDSESSDSEDNLNNSPDRSIRFFDADYYLAQNTDVAAAVETGSFFSAAQHFSLFGFAEGRAPSEVFAEPYLTQNPDVADAVTTGGFTSGFAHFIKFGFAEGRFPSDVFQGLEMFYRSQHPDAAEAVANGISVNGLEHLVTVGFGEGRDPFPPFEVLTRTFDAEYYLAQNADVAEAVQTGGFRSAMEHFVHFGMSENRQPSQAFSNNYYLMNNADVADAVSTGGFPSGYHHYMIHGMSEGRFGSSTPIASLGNFDRLFLAEAGKDILTGMDENTATNPESDSLMSDIGSDFFTLDDTSLGDNSNATNGEGELESEAIANFNADADWLQLKEAGLLPGLNQQEGDRTDWIDGVEEVPVLTPEENAFSFV